MFKYLPFFIVLLGFKFNAQLTLSSSLTACYSFNGNTNDVINNLTGVQNSLSYTNNRFNQANSALLFGGTTSSFLQLPNSPLLRPANAISFSAWVKTTSTSSQYQYILFTNNNCSSFHEGYAFLLMSNGNNAFNIQAVKSDNTCSPSGQTVLNGTTPLAIGTWYHVAFTMDLSQMKIYVNGNIEGTASNTNAFDYNMSDNVYLGGTNISFNLPFEGSMDNVRFYNRVLSANEISQLYTVDPECIQIKTHLDFTNPTLKASLFPNPSQGKFKLIWEGGDAFNYTISNALGENISNGDSLTTLQEIDLSNEANGIYFIQLVSKNKTSQTIKVIKQ
jgi:hypothetical protein